MEITQVRIQLRNEERLKAFVSFTLDNQIAIHNAKVVQGREKMLFCMPSRKMPDGKYLDIVHPISALARKKIEDVIFSAYNEEIKKITPVVAV